MTDAATRHSPASADLERDIHRYRRELTGYCYRMLGSAADTEDAVQEAVIRAHRGLDRFDPARASLRTWVHAIATNVCLDMLRAARRRELLAPVPATVDGELGAPLPADAWLEPMPDSRTVHAADPAEVTVQRESVRLAFLAALQHLPPRQRAALLLRDVFAFSAAETAAALELSVPAVNSALQRARATLTEHRPAPGAVAEPDDPAVRDLLARYVAAFEAHDVAGLRALLHRDTVSSMPPFAWWLSGRDEVLRVFAGSDACAADRLLPVRTNGTIGYGQYRPGEDGTLRPFAIVALEVRDGLVTHSVTFLGTGARFGEYGLPEFLPAHR
jgi:RNA polymerase sigma-70 factor (ECF subfamily)